MDGLASELTQREFNEWGQYFREEPFGQRHQDYLIATLTALVAAFMRDPDDPAPTAEDFIPKYLSPDEAEPVDSGGSAEADLAYVNAMVSAGVFMDGSKEVH